MSPTDPRHGTHAGYRQHRKDGEAACTACGNGAARYERGRQYDLLVGRARSVPALGTRRRVQALAALGHTFTRIGEGMGISGSGAHALAHSDRDTIRVAAASKVAALYETWSMQLPPSNTPGEHRAASRARSAAKRHGWLTPLAWDDIDHDPEPAIADDQAALDDVDEVVVARIVAGEHLPANTRERFAVVARYLELGLPLRDLATRLGWKPERYLPVDEEAVA